MLGLDTLLVIKEQGKQHNSLLLQSASLPLSRSRRTLVLSASIAFRILKKHQSKRNVAAQKDVDLRHPSCPLHLDLSSPSGCICKVYSRYEVSTTRALCLAEPSARSCGRRQRNMSVWYASKGLLLCLLQPQAEAKHTWFSRVPMHQNYCIISNVFSEDTNNISRTCKT